ncbi:MAG: metalloprotease PmbA [Zoogloeaceae bacterium]|nr:metalloprotease PmbA [Zoogloeaceae bacterium]
MALHFSCDDILLRQRAEDTLTRARALGASAAEARVSESVGQSVTVRHGDVEHIEHTRDKSLEVSVYLGRRLGCASTSDLSPEAVRDTVEAAFNIARFTAEDPCAGLPDTGLLAWGAPDPNLFYPAALENENLTCSAIENARRCEAAARSYDARIRNSEGASASAHMARFVLANSLGFMGGYPLSRYDLSCSVIAGEGAAMQRDYWYDSRRNADFLSTPETVGNIAARRAVARLGAKKIRSGVFPVLFPPELAAGLLRNFVHAASGGALYRKTSFLTEQLGARIFPEGFFLRETPSLPAALASRPFDADGVRTLERDVVTDGVLQGYFLGVYSGRKLGLPSTGNAGGCHNLSLKPGALDFPGLLREMRRGLVLSELLGDGVNYVTGDYSRGAAGFWVEEGEIAHPVEEITIAGRLQDMFRGIRAIGGDVEVHGALRTPSLLLEGMVLAA